MTSSTPAEGTRGDGARRANGYFCTAHGYQLDGGSGDIQSTHGVVRPGDRVFKILSVGSSVLVTVSIIAIAVFLLLLQFRDDPQQANFFTYTTERWNLADTSAMYFGIPNLFLVTVVVSILALILAMPVALGIIFLTSCAKAPNSSHWATWSTCSPPCHRSSTVCFCGLYDPRPRSGRLLRFPR